MKLLVIIDLLIILTFVVKVVLLRARAEGFREAQQQANDDNNGNSAVPGFIKFLAVIGFLSMCTLCFYTGMVASALDK
jgi:hypothetical protein